MRTLAILALAVCAVSAIPVAQQPEERVLVDELTTTTTPVPIIKSINKVNDDGSYTFGYEAGDGSFRIEKKELDGHVKGKYGYVDEFGVLQVLEYETGKSAGKSLGFQPSGGLSPFPVVLSESSPEQKVLDFQYSSVDEDEDGMPDDQQRRIQNRNSAPAAAAAQPGQFFPQPVAGVSASASAVSTSGRVARKTRF